jgi:hypothetical protein
MTPPDPTQNVPQIVPWPPPPAGIAESTRHAYAKDAEAFEAYCAARTLYPYPTRRGVLFDYLSGLLTQGFLLPTARRHAYAIRATHRMHGFSAEWDNAPSWPQLLRDLGAHAEKCALAIAASDPANETAVEIGRTLEREAIARDLKALAARDPFSAKGRLLYQLATRYETGTYRAAPAAPNKAPSVPNP